MTTAGSETVYYKNLFSAETVECTDVQVSDNHSGNNHKLFSTSSIGLEYTEDFFSGSCRRNSEFGCIDDWYIITVRETSE